MDKQWVMCDTYNTIIKAVNVYKCKRNQDCGLRDEKVEKKLNAFIVALGKQFDKVVIKGK